jgi:kynurenine formamidase
LRTGNALVVIVDTVNHKVIVARTLATNRAAGAHADAAGSRHARRQQCEIVYARGAVGRARAGLSEFHHLTISKCLRQVRGRGVDEFSATSGAAHCDIRATGTFAGRGILLDLPGHQGVDWLEPGHAITSAELDACADAQGTEVRAGDILLVRTGWLDSFASGDAAEFAQPGLGVDAASFVDDHEIAAVGADNTAIECIPFDDNVFLAVHIELLVKRGVTLMEHLKLSELAADGCHEFFLSVGALPVTGAAGSPINPVAIG